jgi:hypothetical protein
MIRIATFRERWMFALTLWAAMAGVDAEVRNHEAFVLAGQFGMFPPPAVIDAGRKLAIDHLHYVRALRNAGHSVSLLYEREQDMVDDAYLAVRGARLLLEIHFNMPSGSTYLDAAKGNVANLKRLIGPEDYFFGKLPAPMPCMESVHK